MLKCKHCGESFKRSLFYALMIDFAGAKTHDPSLCPDGSFHEFEEEDAKKSIEMYNPAGPIAPTAECGEGKDVNYEALAEQEKLENQEP